MKVFFSPIGTSDPVCNNADGSFIHICRHYRPDKIYIYLSSEMIYYHRRDDRFVKTLELLERDLTNAGIEHKFDIETIEDANLIEVQDYDVLFEKFDKELNNIAKNHKDAEIILNISSGTPAMKSVLQIIASLSDRYRAVQVSTPEKKSNPKREDLNDYDISIAWETNEDAVNAGRECRAKESPYFNFVVRIKKEIIKKHIEAYDYVAAWTVAKDIERKLDKELINLLLGAKERITLNQENTERYFKTVKEKIIPVRGRYRDVMEYLLWLKIKQERKDYADFIRGITPVFYSLCRIALKKVGLDFGDKWDSSILSRSEKGRDVLKILERHYEGKGGFRGGDVKTDNMVLVIKEYCKGGDTAVLAEKIRDIETKLRNPCAHTISEMTEKKIEEISDVNSKIIMDKFIKFAVTITDNEIKTEYFNSYRSMNDLIVKKLHID